MALDGLCLRAALACGPDSDPVAGGTGEVDDLRLGIVLLESALQHKWELKDLDSRVLRVTKHGEREFFGRFGIAVRRVDQQI